MIKINLLFCLIILCGCTTKHNQYIGEEYLGAKYITNPLGEEKSPDTDPLFRTDAFDCMTFIETSLAQGNKNKLTKIRYKDGNIDITTRNHFMETDWLKNNAHIVENISNKYGTTAIKTVTIDKKSWFKKIYNIDTDFKPETVRLEYLPTDNIHKINNFEPIIVLFLQNNPDIRNKTGTDLTVTHTGFLLPNGTLRHASRKQRQVVDTDFYEYIIKRKQNKNNIGITLLKIK